MSETKSSDKWLQAEAPEYDVNAFLVSFVGTPAPIDTNQDGFVDKSELLAGLRAAGAQDLKKCKIMVDSYFDVLDTEKKGVLRVDVFERVYTRLAQYNAISWIKQLVNGGELKMFTKQDGKTDCFFTKEEIKQAFARQLGAAAAAREVDRTYTVLDHNQSSYVGSEKLQTWYFSKENADLRAISLRLKSRTVAEDLACSVQQSAILDEIERQVKELLALTGTKVKSEKRKLKKTGSPENLLMNRLFSRLHGIHDFLSAIGAVDSRGTPVFDAIVSDSIMVPIREAYKLGAIDPLAPPKKEEEEDE